MSNRCKERIFESILISVVIFMVMSIVGKLLVPREGWLLHSILWSISWGVGHFWGEFFATELNEGIGRILFIDIVFILIVLIVVTFIIGVVISLPIWKKIISETVAPFGIALVLNSIWKKY